VGCDSSSSGTDGSGGSAGTGGGTGGTGGGGDNSGPDAVTKTVAVGCSNNVLATQFSSLDWTLIADPGPIVGGESVTVRFDGEVFFSESFLDVALSAVPGLKGAELIDLAATALPRAGLTGDGVVLQEEPIPTTCNGGMNAGNACSTDDECPPVGYFQCGQLVEFPISEDCADGGECDMLGKLEQCTGGSPANGFCITGPLPIPLEAKSGTFTADASGGTVLLGWDDQNTGATTTMMDDGMGGEVEVYVLPAASPMEPVEPNGLTVKVGTLEVALNCTMAIDSGLDPTQVSPTPDADLISFDIE